MLAYVGGDASAHRELFDRLTPPLRVVARRHLRDEAEAEDVVQRTFLALHRARHDFRPNARLRPWVFTIAMNLVRDALRRRARRRERPLELDGRTDPARSPVDPVETRQRVQLVHEALESLPASQRRAIELHWLEEQPFTEIARIEGASLSAVKVRAHRGYLRMKAFIETQRDGRRS
ncbi:MAG: sigma-70 family RNA polymerase sigma factor [Sandaracinaceae bacterium]